MIRIQKMYRIKFKNNTYVKMSAASEQEVYEWLEAGKISADRVEKIEEIESAK
jgi:hypothetical protein